MDELYGLDSSISCSNDGIILGFNENITGDVVDYNLARLQPAETEVAGSDMCDVIKAQMANHPLYPNLVSAYIECRKVGSPPEMALLLEEINKESLPFTTRSEIRTDPELDEFMESYCEALHKYKEELSKPFDEATNFFNSIESQLSSLCKENLTTTTTSSMASGNYHSDEAGGTSDEEDLSCGDVEAAESQDSAVVRHGENELKEMLLHKYSGYLSSLRKEFLKKRKIGKLPKDARVTLMEWWNTHFRWPYPTEEEKMKLFEVTGLNQKQINNWFINQRKRHWRPSEGMRLALMGGVSGSIAGSMYFDAAGGTGSIGTEVTMNQNYRGEWPDI